MSIAVKRLTKEAQQMAGHHEFTSVKPSAENLFLWEATIKGPQGTPYEGGKFSLEFRFSSYYPTKAPTVKFLTRIYHCNINTNGDICLDILKDKWRAVMGVEAILTSILSLLTDPNSDDPLMLSVARMYRENKVRHDEIATMWTERYAK